MNSGPHFSAVSRTTKCSGAWAGIHLLYCSSASALLSFPIAVGLSGISEYIFPPEWGDVDVYWRTVFGSFVSMWFVAFVFLLLAFWRGGTYTRIVGSVYVGLVIITIIGIWIWSFY